MANDRNEAALTKAIAQVLASPEGWRAMAEPVMATELIVIWGALVPRTLTDEESNRVYGAGGSAPEREQSATMRSGWVTNPDALRRELERIAKGPA